MNHLFTRNPFENRSRNSLDVAVIVVDVARGQSLDSKTKATKEEEEKNVKKTNKTVNCISISDKNSQILVDISAEYVAFLRLLLQECGDRCSNLRATAADRRLKEENDQHRVRT